MVTGQKQIASIYCWIYFTYSHINPKKFSSICQNYNSTVCFKLCFYLKKENQCRYIFFMWNWLGSYVLYFPGSPEEVSKFDIWINILSLEKLVYLLYQVKSYMTGYVSMFTYTGQNLACNGLTFFQVKHLFYLCNLHVLKCIDLKYSSMSFW